MVVGCMFYVFGGCWDIWEIGRGLVMAKTKRKTYSASAYVHFKAKNMAEAKRMIKDNILHKIIIEEHDKICQCYHCKEK